ncbi:MAG: GNAT superfamily N-acetyltransferase [Bacteroidia bacterium]|jgi:GNAT superfamily N-acetyltransferase
MPDMIVRLYDLPPLDHALESIGLEGVVVRRAVSADTSVLLEWIDEHFQPWRAEVQVCMAAQPPTCFIAWQADIMLGFAAFDAACRNYFGPTGVAPQYQGVGLGRALLLSALYAQREQGYAYAIIGGVGPAEYYHKAVGAQLIVGSTPGIYVEGWERGLRSPVQSDARCTMPNVPEDSSA